MKTPELDLATPLDRRLGLPSLEQTLHQFDPDITAERDRMLTLIEAIDAKREIEKHIVTFGDKNREIDFVVCYQAMVYVFRRFGVLEAYYEPAGHPRVAKEAEHSNGWNLDLIPPEGRGFFHIVFARITGSSSKISPANQQTVHYKRHK